MGAILKVYSTATLSASSLGCLGLSWLDLAELIKSQPPQEKAFHGPETGRLPKRKHTPRSKVDGGQDISPWKNHHRVCVVDFTINPPFLPNVVTRTLRDHPDSSILERYQGTNYGATGCENRKTKIIANEQKKANELSSAPGTNNTTKTKPVPIGEKKTSRHTFDHRQGIDYGKKTVFHVPVSTACCQALGNRAQAQEIRTKPTNPFPHMR